MAYATNSHVVSNSNAPGTKTQTSVHAKQVKVNSDSPKLNLLAQGQAAFNAHEYKKAFTLWRTLAQQGHPEAQVFVGLAYKNGWGVARDPQQASMWFQIAAEGGNPSAQFFIGLHYITSDNPTMVPIGINWLVQAARNGESSARQFLLKAKRRQWFPIPDNLETWPKVTHVTQVTPNNIDKMFAGNKQHVDSTPQPAQEPTRPHSLQQSPQESLQQARAQIQRTTTSTVR